MLRGGFDISRLFFVGFTGVVCHWRFLHVSRLTFCVRFPHVPYARCDNTLTRPPHRMDALP